MSTVAISRPRSAVFFFLSTITVTLLLLIQLTSAQFPDQFELNSFLYNAPPKTFEADFFRGPRGHSHNNAGAMMAAGPPALRSQNRKFLAKTPEHDKHFATILRQQEAATIRDPNQAAMVADDQMVLRGRGVSQTSLQTSDDDVYEVESAPMEMKSRLPMGYHGPRGFHPGTGHRGRGGFQGGPNPHSFQGGMMPYHRRAQFAGAPEIEASEPEENEGENGGGEGNEGGNNGGGGGGTGLPVSVSFESNIDHSAYEAPEQPDEPEQQQNQRENHNGGDEDWAAPRHKILPLDGDPEEPPFGNFQRPPRGGSKARGGGMGQQKMHFSMGVANDEGNNSGESSYRPPPPAVRPPHRGNPSSSSSFQHQQQPYTHIQYMHMMPASPAEQSGPRGGGGGGGYRGPSSSSSSSSSDEFRSPDWGPSPALHEQSRAQHERELFGAPPVAGSQADRSKAPMESSWLDMGAYSSGKGAFGWYSDVPVAGGGGGHQIMHKK